ncbi:DICT sensory domain-containing protein [Nocardioides bigeumensis]|uniref:HTH merR-type domain-containing protein n=1 Tax=Nocardioides bigeumensis TaxID=433657 RepID=A0ABN2YSE5_9ACTN
MTAGATLSIGDLAERAGVSPGLLRMWETRFGFPEPVRLPSGHRRYQAADVAAVREVLARQQSGLRLDRAVAAVRALRESHEPSIFAAVREADPRLPRQRLRKSTLVGLSHAIEDELCARGHCGFAFAAFQRGEFFERSRRRWQDIARRSRFSLAIADFTDLGTPPAPAEGGPVLVPLDLGEPLREEWAVVCDSPGFAAVLSAWEPPGQQPQADADREFEAVWTLDPGPVRTAARVCLDIAEAAGVSGIARVRADLLAAPTATPSSAQAVTDFCDRVIGALDRRVRG